MTTTNESIDPFSTPDAVYTTIQKPEQDNENTDNGDSSAVTSPYVSIFALDSTEWYSIIGLLRYRYLSMIMKTLMMLRQWMTII